MTHEGTLPPAAAEIAAILREHLPELRERYGVLSLGLFGSYVWGEETEESDIDVLVELDHRRYIPWGPISIEIALSDLLGKQVHLVEKECLAPGIITDHILAEAVPV